MFLHNLFSKQTIMNFDSISNLDATVACKNCDGEKKNYLFLKHLNPLLLMGKCFFQL